MEIHLSDWLVMLPQLCNDLLNYDVRSEKDLTAWESPFKSVSLLPSLNNGGFGFLRYSLGSLEKASDWLTEAFVKQ
nr:hypothetical protein CFP56_46848 [Quercus suber]